MIRHIDTHTCTHIHGHNSSHTHRYYLIFTHGHTHTTPQVGKVQCVLCLDADRSESFSYKHWMDRVESEVPVPPHLPSGDDISTIIYTSGENRKERFGKLNENFELL